MPELPEVETVVRDLTPLLVGRRLAAVTPVGKGLRRPWPAGLVAALDGSRVTTLQRRGKWILLTADRPAHVILHLGMTGQLTVVPSQAERPTHLHLTIDLDEGEYQLRFRDIRRFGSVDLFHTSSDAHAFLNERLGPEPFALEVAPWVEAVRQSSRPLKAILLDQSVIAGVGNIYADEALHRAKLHPLTRGSDAAPKELRRLAKCIVAVLEKAITARGSSIRNYVGGSGLQGGFQREFAVYGRGGEPCLSCEVPLILLRIAGRSSHFCPNCQPAPAAGDPR